MCSNVDIGSDEVTIMVATDYYKDIKWCKKCTEKTEAKILLRKKDAYCRECFLSSVTHKFRACLGKSKVMKPGDKVLIVYSGSGNSTALLHLVKTGLEDTSHKKLMFQPFILFVNESSVFNEKSEELMKISEDIDCALEKYKDSFSIHKVPLELSCRLDEVEAFLAGGRHTSVADSTLVQDVLGSLPDMTSKLDLVNKLRDNLVVAVAESLGCNKVFTAESSDDLAVRLLTNISLGRGSQLPYDVGFSDARFPGVTVVRPLRDLSKKELAFYNIFHNLPSVHVPALITKVDPHTCIQKLTESFLCDLQDGFPSTLSTVFRVADKLTTNHDKEKICPLCRVPLDGEDSSSSSLNATKFSRLVSSSGPNTFDPLTLGGSNCDGGNPNCGSSRLHETHQEELEQILCYSCNLILRQSDRGQLPAEFLKLLFQPSQRAAMENEIEEFLL